MKYIYLAVTQKIEKRKRAFLIRIAANENILEQLEKINGLQSVQYFPTKKLAESATELYNNNYKKRGIFLD